MKNKKLLIGLLAVVAVAIVSVGVLTQTDLLKGELQLQPDQITDIQPGDVADIPEEDITWYVQTPDVSIDEALAESATQEDKALTAKNNAETNSATAMTAFDSANLDRANTYLEKVRTNATNAQTAADEAKAQADITEDWMHLYQNQISDTEDAYDDLYNWFLDVQRIGNNTLNEADELDEAYDTYKTIVTTGDNHCSVYTTTQGTCSREWPNVETAIHQLSTKAENLYNKLQNPPERETIQSIDTTIRNGTYVLTGTYTDHEDILSLAEMESNVATAENNNNWNRVENLIDDAIYNCVATATPQNPNSPPDCNPQTKTVDEMLSDFNALTIDVHTTILNRTGNIATAEITYNNAVAKHQEAQANADQAQVYADEAADILRATDNYINGTPIVTINKGTLNQAAEINWSDATTRVDLGQWVITTTENVTLKKWYFRAGAPGADLTTDVNGLADYFTNMELQFNGSDGSSQTYQASGTFAPEMTGGVTYTITLSATPITESEQTFVGNSLYGNEVSLFIQRVQLADGTVYNMENSTDQFAFDYEEVGVDSTRDYTYGGVTLSETRPHDVLLYVDEGSLNTTEELNWTDTAPVTLAEWTLTPAEDLLVKKWTFRIGAPGEDLDADVNAAADYFTEAELRVVGDDGSSALYPVVSGLSVELTGGVVYTVSYSATLIDSMADEFAANNLYNNELSVNIRRIITSDGTAFLMEEAADQWAYSYVESGVVPSRDYTYGGVTMTEMAVVEPEPDEVVLVVGDSCLTTDNLDGYVFEVSSENVCIAIGDTVPDTDCVVAADGTCEPITVEEPTLTVGDSCLTTSNQNGYVFEVSSENVCIAIGDTVPDTDCVVAANGSCEPIEEEPVVENDNPTLEEALTAETCVDTFIDVQDTDWSQPYICRLENSGVVRGLSPGIYGPNQFITRAETVKILLGIAGYDEADTYGKIPNHPDVNSSDWYYNWIGLADQVGLIRDAGDFRPNDLATREFVSVYVARIAEQTRYGYTQADIPFSDVYATDPFAYAVLVSYETSVDVEGVGTSSVITGYNDGTFKPYNPITRAEVAAIAVRASLAWFI